MIALKSILPKRESLPWLLALIAVLAPFAWLGVHSMAASDDYYDYMLLQKHGAWGAIKHYYLYWSGRMSSFALIFLLRPLAFGETTGPALAAILSLTMLLAFCWLMARVFLSTRSGNQQATALFSLFVCFVLLYIPRPVELLFWFTASMAYLSGLLFIAAWLYLHVCSSRKQIFQRVLYVALPFIIAAGSEINILLLGFLLLITWPNKALQNRAFLFVLFSFITGAALELLAPGSRVRMNYFADAQAETAGNLQFAIQSSLQSSWHFLRDWSRSTPLLLLALIAPALMPINPAIPVKAHNKWWLLAAFALIPILFFPFFYSTGLRVVPDRLLNVIFIYTSASCFVAVPLLWGNLYHHVRISNRFAFLLVVVVLWQASYQSRLRTALFDVSKLPDFRRERLERAEITRRFARSTPNDTLVLRPITAIPYTIFYGDLKEDPTHWFNEGYASYHGIKAVVCKPAKP